MNTISITHKHNNSKENACSKAENLLEELSNKYGLSIETDGEGFIKFSGSGISGNVQICKDEINLQAKLGFFMSAMKPIISTEISNKLDEYFS